MTNAIARKLTYDDLAAMPDDDGLRRELLDGVLFVTPAPSLVHQRASKRLQRQLEAYFERSGRGEVFQAPVDVILGPHDVPEPDLVVVTNAKLLTDRAVEGAPTLVVEILSPSTARRDRTLKAKRYAAAGIPHYWIVDPRRRRIECRRLSKRRYVLVAESGEQDALMVHPDWPGLKIDLRQLWAPSPVATRSGTPGRGRRRARR
jgi:Uma2 family endonuclease